MVARLAQRDGDEQRPLRREHATQLPQRVRARARVVLGVEAVAGVVGADVLEGRDEQHLVDAVVGQRKRADVRRDPLHPLDVALGEVDPDELDARTEEPCEIDGLGVRVADLDDAPRRDET